MTCSMKDGWSIGTTWDWTNGRSGLVARHQSDPAGKNAIRVNWDRHGTSHQVVMCLRMLANAIEVEAAE